MHTEFFSDNLKGRVHAEGLGLDGRIILECILGKEDGKIWIGFVWLSIETSGGRLSTHIKYLNFIKGR